MPDPSAVRPPAPPEEIKSFTKEDIALVAETLGACLNGLASDGRGWFRTVAEQIDCLRNAAEVLTALAAAGRLLPASSEHHDLRQRWQVQYFDTAFSERHAYFYDDRTHADETLAMAHASPRYSQIKLLSRVSTPWTEVDRSPTDA